MCHTTEFCELVSTDKANRVINVFEKDNIVCLKGDSFTTENLDNNDHNPRPLSSDDAFMVQRYLSHNVPHMRILLSIE